MQPIGPKGDERAGFGFEVQDVGCAAVLARVVEPQVSSGERRRRLAGAVHEDDDRHPAQVQAERIRPFRDVAVKSVERARRIPESRQAITGLEAEAERALELGTEGVDSVDEGVQQVVGQEHFPRAPCRIVARECLVAGENLGRLARRLPDGLHDSTARLRIEEAFADEQAAFRWDTRAGHAARCYDGPDGFGGMAVGVPGGGEPGVR